MINLSFTPHEYEAPIPESLTRGGLVRLRGFPDGKPLSPRSLPRVRLPGLNFYFFIVVILINNISCFLFVISFSKFSIFRIPEFLSV